MNQSMSKIGSYTHMIIRIHKFTQLHNYSFTQLRKFTQIYAITHYAIICIHANLRNYAFTQIYLFQFCNRDIFEIIITTPTLIKHKMCEVWLSITDPTECSFFATFWTSWSNLTLTSTLLTNYCKRRIHSSLQANDYSSNILSLSLELARKHVYTSHIHLILISFYFIIFEVP